MPRSSKPIWTLLICVLLCTATAPFGTTVFMPRSIDYVIEALCLCVQLAAAWCAGSMLRAWFERSR